MPVATLFVGTVIGGLGIWLFLRMKVTHAAELAKRESESDIAILLERVQSREQSLTKTQSDLERASSERRELRSLAVSLKERQAQLIQIIKSERAQSLEKLSVVEDAQTKLSDAFKALASDALNSNNRSFLELAKTSLEKFQESAKGDLEKRQQAISELVKPVKESLDKVDAKIQDIEKARVGAYEGLTQQVKSLSEGQKELRCETSNLVTALRAPTVRGRWGEIQLKRVVELAGMLDYCDFYQQESVNTEDGQLRPDLLVRLPGRKNIVVDAKVPLSCFLEAIESADEHVRKAKFEDHAKQVRKHIACLSKKAYFAQFDPAPEFVILFLPGEVFYSAALEHDPALIEIGVEQNVIIATPTTLIALLKAVAYGWRQECLAENAKEISDLGRELYKRLSDMGGHLARLGKNLNNATEAYNKTVGSLETRVLVTARRFQDLGIGTDEIEPLQPIEQMARALDAKELRDVADSNDSNPLMLS
jgi:DNA recombination protein RmuC